MGNESCDLRLAVQQHVCSTHDSQHTSFITKHETAMLLEVLIGPIFES